VKELSPIPRGWAAQQAVSGGDRASPECSGGLAGLPPVYFSPLASAHGWIACRGGAGGFQQRRPRCRRRFIRRGGTMKHVSGEVRDSREFRRA